MRQEVDSRDEVMHSEMGVMIRMNKLTFIHVQSLLAPMTCLHTRLL